MAYIQPKTPIPGLKSQEQQALWACTVGGATAQGDEGNRGSLEVGHWADLVILEDNLRDPYCLGVFCTLVGGKETP